MKAGKTMGRPVYGLIQCTWGGLQTVLGLLLFLRYVSSPHEWYHGAVHTRWNVDGGISLGLFIFCLSLKGRRLSLIQMNPYKPRGVPALALSVLTLAFLPLSTPYRDV